MRARFRLAPAAFSAATLLAVAGAASADTHRATCPGPSHDAPLRLTPGATSTQPFAGAFAALTFGAPRPCDTPATGDRLELTRAVSAADATEAAQTARPVAFIYSEAYLTRARIHKRASYAMLPLFISEAVLGQKMFNNPSQLTNGKRTAHKVIGMGIGGLFAVNSVTGGWNLIEGRKDPDGLMRRTIHGTLMMVADLGFLASAATRPNSRTANGLAIYDAKKNQHMTIAYASISVATVGYLMMLFR